jgi:hypothetical protein
VGNWCAAGLPSKKVRKIAKINEKLHCLDGSGLGKSQRLYEIV